MSVKVMCAGCTQEERERAEADVRSALGASAQDEAWTVSLVKMNDRWSVTLSTPRRSTITCVAPQGRVAEAIRDAVGGAAAPAPAAPAAPTAPAKGAAAPARPVAAGRAPAPAAPARSAAPVRPPASAAPQGGPQRVRHQCGSCHAAFVVSYEAAPDEGEETVAVACPHCWHKNYVLIAESAAESRDYTAEKA
jgi:hypothetical protein